MSGPRELAERAEDARQNRELREHEREALKKRIRYQYDSTSTPTSIARAIGVSGETARRYMMEMGLWAPKTGRDA